MPTRLQKHNVMNFNIACIINIGTRLVHLSCCCYDVSSFDYVTVAQHPHTQKADDLAELCGEVV